MTRRGEWMMSAQLDWLDKVPTADIRDSRLALLSG
jgi:hypothetical protein